MKLYPFQQEAVDFMVSRPRTLLADDRGLGKTVMALSAIQAAPVLIMAGTSYLHQWEAHAQEWVPGLPAQMLRGSRQENLDTIKSLKGVQDHILITTRDSIRVYPHLFTSFDWGTVIIDEAHHLSGRQSQRARDAWKLRAEKMFLLTGTPIRDHAQELWTLLRMMFGREKYPSFWRWANRYWEIEETFWGKRFVGVRDPDAIMKQLEPCYIRRTKEDVGIQLPPKTLVPLWLDPTPSELRVYRQAEEELFVEGPQGVTYIESPAKLLVTLRRILADPQRFGATGAGAKINALKEIVSECRQEDQKFVVFTWYRDSLDTVSDVLNSLRVPHTRVDGSLPQGQRQRNVLTFQKAQGSRALIGTLGTISEGMNLDEATVAILFEKSWTPGINDQASDRLHRITQTRPVTIYEFLVKGTIDARVERVCQRKQGVIDEVIVTREVLKEMLDERVQ